MTEKHVSVMQNMYEGCTTVVKYAVELTKWFNEKVGLRQGSALRPFLFAMIMDRLTNKIDDESPWTTMLADDICFM